MLCGKNVNWDQECVTTHCQGDWQCVTDTKQRNYITESCSQKIYFGGYLNETEYVACIKKMSSFNLSILIEEYKLNLCVTS